MKLIKIYLLPVIVLLIISCAKPQDQLFKAVEKGDTGAAVKAMEKGADLNIKDKNGYTALMIAASGGEGDLIYGILDAADRMGKNPEPENLQLSYDLAENNSSEVQAVFHIFSSAAVQSETRFVYSDGGLDLLKTPDSQNGEVLQHLDNNKEVAILERSPFRTDTGNGTSYWVYVSDSGSQAEGWTLESGLTEIKGGRMVRFENEQRIIDAFDGLRMRDYPGLDSNKLTTLPGGVYVDLLAEFGEEMTIGGAAGRWSLVDWNGSKGSERWREA